MVKKHENTLIAANNCASTLLDLNRYAEAKALLRETMPVARRVIGDDHNLTLKLRWAYAEVLYKDDGATLADLREAVTTLEDAERMRGACWRRAPDHRRDEGRRSMRTRRVYARGLPWWRHAIYLPRATPTARPTLRSAVKQSPASSPPQSQVPLQRPRQRQ